MPPGGDQDRTEKATPKKLRDAREKGQVAKSREAVSVAVLMASLTVFHFIGGNMFRKLLEVTRFNLSHLHREEFTDISVIHMMRETIASFGSIMAPLLLTVAAAGLFSNYIQIGFIFTGHQLKPDLSKLSPLKGFQRLFSLRSLVELAKSLIKLAIVASVAFLTVKSEMDGILPLTNMSAWEIAAFISDVSFEILVRTCWVLVVLAILDFAYQKWEHAKGMKMSKQEVKDEFKQTEGDPLIRSRIRSLQREMARRRMMEQVPKADVVITNPTHFAVALRYEKGMGAPVVVAKGAGFIAERIKKVAREHGVHIVENKSVARLLYKVCSIGAEIPSNLYKAVAEILAHVYRLKGKNTA